ncbi:MAG: secretin and TonB N-terminal domain-containing protein [Chlorobium sp.]|nr:secretin and TonB N-terminal domain-containing protein [Chlorobium sp.]
MFHFFPGTRRTGFILFCILLIVPLVVGISSGLKAEDTVNQILSITSRNVGSQVEVRIKGSNPLITTVYELPKPSRIIVDVAEAKLAAGIGPKIEVSNHVALSTSAIADAKPPITRLEFALSESFPYTSTQEGNDIILTINTKDAKQNLTDTKAPVDSKASSSASEAPLSDPKVSSKSDKTATPTKDQVGGLINQKKNIESQLPEIDPLAAKLSPKAKEQQLQDNFNFSGYKKERITVEFQKMDLHNVFNFLRQVSGVNIVVDESVQGSLTLVLDDVPWDFALEIILNLKGLEKEERFNTLVIYPKGKGFKWPENVQNNLSFQADSQVVAHEALVIKQQEGQPVVVVEAKQEMTAAREAEKRENYETAVRLYEQAYEKWPANSKLANKISSLYLVQLRQNAKALYYAQKALAKEPNNSTAALNAAIASANMQDKQKAHQYFDQSISAKKPSKEALLSYAVFNEEQHEYNGALKILEKHDALYGNDLTAMVAVARIYDKMGKREQATQKYQAILSSGFAIPSDLSKYIQGRVALKTTM